LLAAAIIATRPLIPKSIVVLRWTQSANVAQSAWIAFSAFDALGGDRGVAGEHFQSITFLATQRNPGGLRHHKQNKKSHEPVAFSTTGSWL
jgi:hypothetical protein